MYKAEFLCLMIRGGRDERKRFCESRSETPRPDVRKFADCGGKKERIVAGFKSNPSEKAGSVAYGIETAPCLSAAAHDACVMVLENHPNDSRIKLSKDNIIQTLSKRMGTGGAIHR